jgi:CheY-like chemotaxis protein
MLTRDMLRRLGYEVIIANSPAEALSEFRAHGDRIALVFSDVVMPPMNGPVLIERLAELKPGLTFMFMSGYTAEATARGPGAGAIDVSRLLQKPFTLPELARAVRRALNET